MQYDPKEALAHGDGTEALHRATWNLTRQPQNPSFHLDLLAALVMRDPARVPVEGAFELFDFYLSSSNFPAALAVLVLLGRIPREHDDALLRRFLDTFGPSQPAGHGAPPAKTDRGPEEDDGEEIPLPSVDEEEVFQAALDAWKEARGKLPVLPPARGWRVPLFSAMSPDSLRDLLRKGEIRFLAPQDVVIRQGDTDDSLFVLVTGVLEVFREEDGIRRRLGYLRSGSFFGEMALVTRSPRFATVQALESSLVLRIPWNLLESMLGNDPALADELARYTRMRLLQNLLATSPLFRLLPKEAKLAVAGAFTPEFLQQGDVVVQEGKPSAGLYLVASGEMDVISGHGRDSLLLARLNAGEVFGEISLIRESAATATVQVHSPSAVLLALRREAFQKLAVQFPELLSHVYAVAVERSQHTERAKSEVSMPAEDLLV